MSHQSMSTTSKSKSIHMLQYLVCQYALCNPCNCLTGSTAAHAHHLEHVTHVWHTTSQTSQPTEATKTAAQLRHHSYFAMSKRGATLRRLGNVLCISSISNWSPPWPCIIAFIISCIPPPPRICR